MNYIRLNPILLNDNEPCEPARQWSIIDLFTGAGGKNKGCKAMKNKCHGRGGVKPPSHYSLTSVNPPQVKEVDML